MKMPFTFSIVNTLTLFTPTLLRSYTSKLLHSFSRPLLHSSLLHSLTPSQLDQDLFSDSLTRRLGRNVLDVRLTISTAFTFCSHPCHPIGTEQSHLPVQVKYTAVSLMFTWLEIMMCRCGQNCSK